MRLGLLSAFLPALATFTQAHPTNQNVTWEDGAVSNGHGLPIIDLGYEKHQAIDFNSTGNYYNFSNIRYAAPPLGNLRFALPQKPAKNRTGVQNGAIPRACPQATPAWELTALQFIPQYLAGSANIQTNSSTSNTKRAAGSDDLAELNEDCLFLDVFTPKKVFECDDGKGAPVLVWIYGGGYVAGSKTGSGDPAGLIKRSDEGIVFVAINYRLGALGWLSGPEFTKEGGVANAALHDQRLALKWVQEHIADFGGDPDRVTIMGESAGGGSIVHQITAYGGKGGDVPFNQAIAQSPGFLPIVSGPQQDTTFSDFLSLAGVSSLAEARNLSSTQVINANIYQVAVAPYGTFVYGPAVDGSFVPDLPGPLLQRGDFHKDVNVMVGHNADEGLLFTSPYILNDTDIKNALRVALPTLSNATVDYIVDTLYPESEYKDITARAATIQADFGFVCNTYYLDTGFKNETHAYKFDIFPAIHGQDVPYTFYNDGGVSGIDFASGSFGIASVDAAITLQDWITSFTIDGTPTSNVANVPPFPTYGPNAQALELLVNGTVLIKDDAANKRCQFWQTAFK